MSELDSILRAIDLLESRLRAPVKIAEAAEAAGYSLFHFSRLFSQLTRQTPYEYLMRRRLTEAAHVLAGGERRVLDIALEYQFTTSEGFARAFRRMFDQLPNQVRQGQAVDPRVCMPPLSAPYLQHLQRLRPVPRPDPIPALELAGWMTLCTTLETPSSLLQALLQEVGPWLDPSAPFTLYGLQFYPQAAQGATALYFAGLEPRLLSRFPASLVQKSLPAQALVCFDHPAPLERLPLTLAYIFHTWLPHSQAPRLPDMLVQRCQFDAPASASAPRAIQVLLPLPS